MFGEVLVIESNFSILGALAGFIEKEGFHVYIAYNVSTGIELISKLNPSLIICSTSLPDSDIAELREILAKIQNRTKIPVLFLSPKPFLIPAEQQDADSPDGRVFSFNQIEDLLNVIKKMLKLENNRSSSSDAASAEIDSGNLTESSRITLKVNKAIKVFRLSDIEHITAYRDYTYVFTKSDGDILIKKTLKSWENILPKNIFLRIHRSAILNMDHVDSISRSQWHTRSYTFITKFSKKEFLSSQRYNSRIKTFLFK
ncbi:MAG: LytR/AlgR family response regulator transcription factor [Syntrophothermus sp.]